MEKGKYSKLMVGHLIVMAALCLMSIASAIIIFTGNIPSGYETLGEAYKTTHTLYGIAHIVNALALACGMTYLMKGSSKQTAIWYKAFVVQVMLGVLLRLIGTLIMPGFGLPAALMIGVIIALLVLSFVKNLGEKNTWIVFYILLALELVLAIVSIDKGEVLSSIAGGLIRLVLAGSIGLAIHAKYADKKARHTK